MPPKISALIPPSSSALIPPTASRTKKRSRRTRKSKKSKTKSHNNTAAYESNGEIMDKHEFMQMFVDRIDGLRAAGMEKEANKVEKLYEKWLRDMTAMNTTTHK